MACCLVGAEPFSEPMLEYCSFGPQEQTLNKHLSQFTFFHENAFENVVCEMAAILARPQCVNISTMNLGVKMSNIVRH